MSRPPVLEVRNLSKSFKFLHVLQGVSLECAGGQITGLIGRNGSGKSTLLNCISGKIQADDGAILLRGTALPAERAWKRAQRGVGWTFQEVSMPLTLTPAELLEVSAKAVRTPMAQEIESSELEAEAARFIDQPWCTLSFGQRKLTEILVAAARRPRLLLLDEPVAGLSRHIVPLVGKYLKRLAASGIAILLVEHNRQFVTDTADQLHLLSQGKIVRSGMPDDVFAASVTLETLL